MKSEINPDILEKIKNSSQSESMKKFLFKILELEYDKLDESNPKLKDDYVKLIDKYKNWGNILNLRWIYDFKIFIFEKL